jgi:ribosomal protein S17E
LNKKEKTLKKPLFNLTSIQPNFLKVISKILLKQFLKEMKNGPEKNKKKLMF